jgi:hypothetical protein
VRTVDGLQAQAALGLRQRMRLHEGQRGRGANARGVRAQRKLCWGERRIIERRICSVAS